MNYFNIYFIFYKSELAHFQKSVKHQFYNYLIMLFLNCLLFVCLFWASPSGAQVLLLTLCPKESLLNGLKDNTGCWRSKPSCPGARKVSYPLYYLSSPMFSTFFSYSYPFHFFLFYKEKPDRMLYLPYSKANFV